MRGRDSLVRCDSEAVISDGLNLDRWGGTFWWGLDTRWGSDGVEVYPRRFRGPLMFFGLVRTLGWGTL